MVVPSKMLHHTTELPAVLWSDAKVALTEEIKRWEEAKGKKKQVAERSKGSLIIRFTYSLSDRKFVDFEVQTASNLFLEYTRSTGECVSSQYIIVQMDDEDLNAQSNQSFGTQQSTKSSFAYDVDPLRETILRNGIRIGDEDNEEGIVNKPIVFNLIGCSNSQVQKHCYIFRRSKDLNENEARILEVLPDLRQLEKKKGIPKRVKYAGLLFSGITVVKLPPAGVIVEEIESKENNGFDFTDGPGLISQKLAVCVKEKLGIKGACPSIFQIRYCGKVLCRNGEVRGHVCKGVLVVDPTNDESYRIQVRKSMLKVVASLKACEALQGTLGICEYSRPSPGRLGQQQICLLSGTVKKDDLLQLQKVHLECLKNALHEPFSMAWVLALDRRHDVWETFHKLILAELEGTKTWNGQAPRYYRKCYDLILNAGRGCDTEQKKVQLQLATSRNLFGAVYPEALHYDLEEGGCVVLLEDGPLFSHKDRPEEPLVIVSRSPSYHPGDIRVLRVVTLPDDHPALKLRNCILFSTRGERPDPDKMGGGDLDGDKYLVIWHPSLLKYASSLRAIEAACYNDSPKMNGNPAKDYDWIHYAAATDNSMLGEVENTFYKLAKKHGIKSSEIEKLNSLFSSLVDRHPTSLDAFKKLRTSVSWEMSSGACVWEEMAVLQADCHNEMGKVIRKSKADNVDLKSYQSFHENVTQPTTARQLTVRIREELNHNLKECMLKFPISKTLAAIEHIAKSNGLHIGDGDSPIGDEKKDTHLERLEVKYKSWRWICDYRSFPHALRCSDL